MKNFLTSLLFIFLLSILFSCRLFSQIQTGGKLSFGYEDRIIAIIDGTNNKVASSYLRNKGYAKIYLDARYKHFFVYTGVKTYMYPQKIYMFDPVQASYSLGLGYKLKHISFSYEHFCSHSIFDTKLIRPVEHFYEAYDRISVCISLWGDNNYVNEDKY